MGEESPEDSLEEGELALAGDTALVPAEDEAAANLTDEWLHADSGSRSPS